MSIHFEPEQGIEIRTWLPGPSIPVLLVEDDESYRHFIEVNCRRVDWVSLHCVDRLAAVPEALSACGPAVILLDVNLPDGDGVTWLQSHRHLTDAAVVVLTGDATHDPGDIAAFAQDYLVKSQIAPDHLLRAIRYACERRRVEQAVRQRDEQLRQAQKMDAIGRLAGGIAHDFGNLLTVITEACERMRDTLDPSAPALAEAEKILRSSSRAVSLTRQLMAFSRAPAQPARRLHLGALVRSVGQLLEQLIGEHILLTVEIAPDLQAVQADPVQVEQVLMNLAINARDAMPRGGLLRIAVANDGTAVRLQVSDSGTGMTADVKARAFEPFFTTKGDRGTGLGLATVYGNVMQMGGRIDIETAAGEGTTFVIHLPAAEGPVNTEATHPPEVPARGNATILLTEDEPDVRDLLREMLAEHGYTVLVADSAADALSYAESFKHDIDLLLTDIVMPGGTGRALAQRLRSARPDLKVLLMSGYPDQRDGATTPDGDPLLAKPFSRADLLARIHSILATA